MKTTTARHCDWMTDVQLTTWIEATSRYLADAMAEARERGLLDPCDYCGKTGHRIDACPVFERDRNSLGALDSGTDKTDWPL